MTVFPDIYQRNPLLFQRPLGVILNGSLRCVFLHRSNAIFHGSGTGIHFTFTDYLTIGCLKVKVRAALFWGIALFPWAWP